MSKAMYCRHPSLALILWLNGTSICSGSAQEMFRVPLSQTDKFALQPYHRNHARAPLLADFDGDGLLDVVVVDWKVPSTPPYPNSAFLYLNSGNGQMVVGSVTAGPGVEYIFGLASADVDGDGDTDLLALRAGLTIVRTPAPNVLYLNDGTGRLVEAPPGRLPTHLDCSIAGVFADVDGDGDLDLFVANRGQNRLYLNDGRGMFADATTNLPIDDDESTAVVAADLDGDGWVDLAVGAGTSNYYLHLSGPKRIYINRRNGQFGFGGFPSVVEKTDGVAAGDVDGDGDVDLVFSNLGPKSRLYINQGLSALFVEESHRLPVVGLETYAPLLVDVDGDGDLDLLGINLFRPVLSINDGTGHFQVADPARFPSPNMWALSWSAGDIDNDGDVDLVALHDVYKIFLNQKRQVMTPPDPKLGGQYALTVHADAGSLVLASLALGRRPIAIPPWGVWHLDPATMLSWPPFFMGPSRTATMQVPIPVLPALRGRTLYGQAVDVRTGGHFMSFMFDVVR